MFEVVGKYNRAIVYAMTMDPQSYAQILRMCNTKELQGSAIRMMPDTHASAGCTVGTSLTYTDAVNPSYVGDDIGCGMNVWRLRERDIDLPALDAAIRELIPTGPRIHAHRNPRMRVVPVRDLYCYDTVRHDTVGRSLGTLGGGNHFIEVARGGDGALWLIVHSGSRRLGRDVAGAHRIRAYFAACGIDPEEAKRKKMRPCEVKAPFSMDDCFLSGPLLDEYLHDMRIAVRYADESRLSIGETLLGAMHLHPDDSFCTIHNYIDIAEGVLRKGAVSARAGQRLIVPINMSDGSLLCVGRGNPDWNMTAPHGAGRVLRRSEAKGTLDMEEYRMEMEGIYSTSVNLSTLDESPMAYRRIDEIRLAIADTAEVTDVLKPVYNFKSGRPTEDEETADGED